MPLSIPVPRFKGSKAWTTLTQHSITNRTSAERYSDCLAHGFSILSLFRVEHCQVISYSLSTSNILTILPMTFHALL